MPLLVSLTSQRATYFALKLDGSWTESVGEPLVFRKNLIVLGFRLRFTPPLFPVDIRGAARSRQNSLVVRRSEIHPCNNVTQPHGILLILKSAGVFTNHGDSTTQILGRSQASHAGNDSRSTKSVPVGTTWLRRKPARARRSRYSSTVRSRPPVRTSIYRSMALPSEGWLGSERPISTRRSAPFSGTTLRQFRRICRASSSFQSWMTLFIR